MDAGASIIAFVTIGLQSVKTVYGIISAIKDGPSKLDDLRGAIENLQSLLEQMQHNPGLTTSTPSSLLPLVQRCVNDIQRFEARISKVYVPPGQKSHGKFWKRLKLVFKEKDIPYMISVVTGHLNSLSLHCNVRLMTAVKEMSTQQQGLDHIMTNVAKDVTAISSSTTHVDIIAGQSEIREMLNTMAPGVAAISTLSTVQTGMADSLNELKQLYQEMTAALARSSPHDHHMEYRGQPEEVDTWSSRLSNQLNQLFNLFGEEPRTIPTSNAEDTIELIETLLDSIRKDFLTTSNTDRPILLSEAKTLARELKQLAARFTTAPFIRVNTGGSTDLIPITGQMTNQESKETLIRSSKGILAISKKILRRVQSDQPESNKSNAMSSCWKSHTAVALLLRGGDLSGMLLKISLREATSPQWTGLFALAPSISVHRTISSNSDVFQCIRRGSLDDLIQLLNDGKASLRDRDEEGASLLHYACHAGQYEICAFLINRGADIDDIASLKHVHGFVEGEGLCRTPLEVVYGMAGRLHRNDRMPCFKLLLEKGADPMLGNVAWWAFQTYTSEFAIAFFTFGQLFVDINVKLSLGWSFLHSAAYNNEFMKFKFLIDHGIIIDAVNNKGMTSLQMLLSCLSQCRSWSDGFESIKYLIRHGANIHATNKGKSCSAIAYENDKAGSYAGDVWDAALAETGHSVQEFRESYPHRSCYSGRYTPEIFKKLWEGMEDRCPYYAEATRGNTDREDEEELIPGMTDLHLSDSDEWETDSEAEYES